MLVTPAQAYFAPSNGQAAALVLGQPNFTSNSTATTQSGMSYPVSVFVDSSGRLWVANYVNNRVLRFDNAATIASGANADGVLGQTDFTSNNGDTTQNGMYGPLGLYVDSSGRLWVADYGNSRVLRFDNAAAKSNGANADGVLGQPDFNSLTTATTQNGMRNPVGVFVDSSGRLWVVDFDNTRVLRFDNAAAKADGANADGVLGQPDFTSRSTATTRNGMNYPNGVAVDNVTGRLYVADSYNNRILVFNSAASLANGANASYVLGQTSFTMNTSGTSAATLSNPVGVFYDPATKVLLVGDYGNNRVLMYGKPSHYFSPTSTAAYDGWVLESTATSGKGGTLSAAGTLRVGDDASNKQYRSILYFNTSSLPNNAVIHGVMLKIYKAGVVGTDPLTLSAFGTLLADIKKGTFGAVALEKGDFQATASASAIGHFSSIGGGWYQLGIPASDYKYVNLAGVTQFRLRFTSTSNNNKVADYDTFDAGEAASANRPVLSVEYTLP